MKLFAIFCIVLLSSSALGQIPDTNILNKRTAFPCLGFNDGNSAFYNFDQLPKSIRFNVPTIKSRDGQEYWVGEAVFFPCNEQFSVKSVEDDCGKGHVIGSSVGYYRLRKNVEGSAYTCYNVAQTDSRDHWKLKFDSNEGERGAWIATSNSTADKDSISYQSTFVLNCGIADIPQNLTSLANHQNRSMTFKLTSRYVCPYTSGTMVNYLSGHRALPFVMLGLAIFVTFFGYYFIKTVLFIMGFLVGLCLALFGLSITALIKINDPNLLSTNKIILAIFIVVMVACLLGYVFAKLTKFYFMLAGGFLGYMLSFKAFELLVMITSKSNDVAQIIVAVICVIMGVVVGYYLHDHVMILSTAFGGAFLITLCVGTMLKNYPDLDNLPNYSKLDPAFKKRFAITFACYTAAWLLIGVLGAITQYVMKNKKKDESAKETPEDGYLSYDADPTADRNYY